MSDGVPTIQGSGSVCTESFANAACGVNSIQSDIIGANGIMNLKNNPLYSPYISSITLNTAYYFNNTSDPNAIALLQQMSAAGNGQFLQFGSGQNNSLSAIRTTVAKHRESVSRCFRAKRERSLVGRRSVHG